MAKESLDPRARLLRSPLYRWHEEHGARFEEVHDGAVVAGEVGRSADAEVELARRLAVIDCSTLPRIGFKGPAAIDWVAAQGVRVGTANNRAWRQPDGSWVARLADSEALLLAPLAGGGDPCPALEAAWRAQRPHGCALILRRHVSGWLCLLGECAARLLAKLCGVDLRPRRFPEGSVAQTSAARTGVIIGRADVGAVPAYHLLPDSASTRYLWACILDAMREFEGRAVGLRALRALAREE